MRGFLRATYLIVCNTLLLCIALEVFWRGAGLSRGTASEEAATSPEDVPYTLHPYFQTIYRPEPDSLPGPFLTGWRADPPEEAETEGRLRIMFLGGSTSANMYPNFVRAELEQLGPTTIYNLAFHWHCSLHSLYKFWTYCDEVRPDLVVVLENVNDFYRGFTSPDTSLEPYRPDYSHCSGGLHPFWLPGKSRFDGREVFYARPGGRYRAYEAHDTSLAGLFRSIADESAVWRALVPRTFVRTQFAQELTRMDESVYLRSLPAFRRNLENLARSCELKGVPVVFLTMPFTLEAKRIFLPPGNFFTNDGFHHLAPEDFADGMRRFNDVVRSLADEPRAYVVDAAAEITDPLLFNDEVHLTEEGQRVEAGVVARRIVESGVLVQGR